MVAVLRSKHPALRDPDTSQSEADSAFAPYPHVPEVVPFQVTAKTIEVIANQLLGSAGTSGVDAAAFSSCSYALTKSLNSLGENLPAGLMGSLQSFDGKPAGDPGQESKAFALLLWVK